MYRIRPITLSKTVTTAGTAERLNATALKCVAGIVQAKTANTGTVHLGDSTVHNSTKPGRTLTAAQHAENPRHPDGFYDLYDLWIDVSVSGEGVDITYWVEEE